MKHPIVIPDILPQDLPRLCHDLPKVGGVYKTIPEDFRVDELAHTTWSGTGEYLYLRLEKLQMTSHTLAQHIHHVLEVPFPSIRMAGRKDKRAITSQWISVRHGDESKAKGLETRTLRPGQQLKLLDIDRHHVPMAFGVHGGNRFHIVVRQIPSTPESWQNAQKVVKRLSVSGIPNYYGEQRLGEDNVELGREILLDRYEGVPLVQARFLISSYQAQLFNNYLAYRFTQDYWDKVLVGDCLREATVDRKPATVICTEQDIDRWQQHSDEFSYLITGPMFGSNFSFAEGLPGLWEHTLLEQEELTLEDFFNEEFRYPWGSRRPIRQPVQNLALSTGSSDDHIHLDFTLPPGGYATIVLREFGAHHAITFNPSKAGY